MGVKAYLFAGLFLMFLGVYTYFSVFTYNPCMNTEYIEGVPLNKFLASLHPKYGEYESGEIDEGKFGCLVYNWIIAVGIVLISAGILLLFVHMRKLSEPMDVDDIGKTEQVRMKRK